MLSLWMALATTTGCYKNTIVTGKPVGTEQHTKRHRFLLWGLVGSPTYNVDKLCPQGVARIEEEVDVPAAAVTLCTGGLLSPRAYTITCASGEAWNLEEVSNGWWVADLQDAEGGAL